MAAAKRKVVPAKPSALPILLVGASAVGLRTKQALLQQAGFDVTCADNICYAEMYSDAQFFEVAVYDQSLSHQEQVSLARVMRLRWPWMRLVRCGDEPISFAEPELFNSIAYSEEELPEVVFQSLNIW